MCYQVFCRDDFNLGLLTLMNIFEPASEHTIAPSPHCIVLLHMCLLFVLHLLIGVASDDTLPSSMTLCDLNPCSLLD